MTTLTQPPATEAGEAPARDPGRLPSVLALAWAESRQLIMYIPMIVFLCFYVVLTARGLLDEEGMDDFPVLNQVDRATAGAPLAFLAVAMMICANTAAQRSRSDGTDELYGVAPMEPWRRTLAHILSTVPFVLFTTLVIAVQFGWSALKPGAVGQGSPGELLAGPLTMMLAGIAGVLLARLWPWRFAPVFGAITFYFALTLLTALGDHRPWVAWLTPVVSGLGTESVPVPTDLLGRTSAGWHAVYVAGVCVLLVCAALAVTGCRTRTLATLTVLALGVTVTGGIGQIPRDGAALAEARKVATRTPQRVQSCAEIDGSRYCSFPEWGGQRADWAEVVRRVQSAAGGTAADRALTVRQRIDVENDISSDYSLAPATTPDTVTIGTRWGGNRVPEFAAGVAAVLVYGTESAAYDRCDARMVTTLWLALANDSAPKSAFTTLRLTDSASGSSVILSPTDSLHVDSDQTEVLNELLTRPKTEVTAAVKSHWTELTSKKTTTAEAARILGVAVPKGAEKCEE